MTAKFFRVVEHLVISSRGKAFAWLSFVQELALMLSALSSWCASFCSVAKSVRKSRRQHGTDRNRYRPQLETLENRIALTTLSINGGAALGGNRNEIVTVPVHVSDLIDSGSFGDQVGISAADFDIKYDFAVFTVNAGDVHLGTILNPASDWLVTVNAQSGEIAIGLSTGTPITTPNGGILVTIDFLVNASAPLGATQINLASSGFTVTGIYDSSFFPYLLNPAPTNAVTDPGIDMPFTVTDTSPNFRPVANNDAFSFSTGSPFTVGPAGVLANDSDPQFTPLTAVNYSLPAHGTLTGNADGSFTYTPTDNTGYYIGPDSFTYQVQDRLGLRSNSATVNLTVTPTQSRLSIPQNLIGTSGTVVTVPVNIDNLNPNGNGLSLASLALTFDPSVFTVSATDVHLGSVPNSASGWTFSTSIGSVASLGQISITLSSATPIDTMIPGSLATIDFHIKDTAFVGPHFIDLAASTHPLGTTIATSLTGSNGPIALDPGPTNATNDPTDGIVTIAADLISPNDSITGDISVVGEAAFRQFTLLESGEFTAQVHASGANKFHSRLSLLDAVGNLLIQSDGLSPVNLDNYIRQSLPAGDYYLEIEGIGGETGSFSLTTCFYAGALAFNLIPAGISPGAIAKGDFNEDGKLDLAVKNGTGVTVLIGNGSGTFRSAVDYPLKHPAESIVVGDFGNGHLDLAIAGSGYVSVLLGNGDGTFQPGGRYAIGSGINDSLILADLGNGHLDLATTGSTSNTVSILLGNGDGTFQPAASYAVAGGPNSLVIGDFGDGHVDLATANYYSNSVSVLLGNGDGTFQPAVSYPVGDSPRSLVVGDFGNGHLDLATANVYSNDVSVLLGNGDGTFRPAIHYALSGSPVWLVVDDFGNGHLDIAAVGDGYLSVLNGNGDGTFQTAVAYALSGYLGRMVVTDFGNGHRDLAIKGSSHILVLLGNGDGTFRPAVTYGGGDNLGDLVIGDVGNGHLDLITTVSFTGAVSVLLGNGDGTFQTVPTNAVANSPRSLAVGDFGNGQLDLVTTLGSAHGMVSVLVGNGDGTFQPAVTYAAGDVPNAVVTGDFNNDGRMDLAVANLNSYDVSVLLGNGDGTFQPGLRYRVGTYPHSLVTGDFGNGYLDLAVAGDGILSVLVGNGDGTFQPAVSYRLGGGLFNSLVVGDFGNGHLDLATANDDSFSATSVSVLLGNGDGTFQPAVNYAIGAPFSYFFGGGVLSIVVEDFGNGHQDLAVSVPDSNRVSVLLGNGDGTFQAAVNYAVGGSPGYLVVGDFGNGHLDLATANTDSNDVSVLLGNGDGSFQPAVNYALGDPPGLFDSYSFSLVMSDFGNGHPDLALANHNSNIVTVLLGKGDGTFQSPVSYAVGDGPVSLVLGDLGNGHPDLVTANSRSGDVSVLLGIGDGTFVSSANISNPIHSTPLLADCDGDGITDSIIVSQLGTILYRKGRAGEPGTFDPPVIVNPTTSAREIASLLTNQGVYIAAIDARANAVSLYQWNSGGRIARTTTLSTGPFPTRILAGNLYGDADGMQDDLLVLNSGAGTVSIFRGHGSGGFSLAQTIFVGLGSSNLALGQNQHEAPEILVTNQVSGDVTILINDGHELFTAADRFRAGEGPYGFDIINQSVFSKQFTNGVVPGDFTGDGQMDALTINAGSHSLGILQGQGQGSYLNPQITMIGFQPAVIVQGNLDDDDHLDVAILNKDQGTISILLGESGGFHEKHKRDAGGQPIPLLAGATPTGLSVADVNQDGFSDLLVGNIYGDILILLGNGDGTFRPFRTRNQVSFVTHDFNGDDIPDVLLANEAQDQALILIRQPGTDTFTVGNFYQDNSNGLQAPGGVTLQDLNGDGVLDSVVVNSGGNNVLVYISQSNGTFKQRVFTVGDSPMGLTVYDLNDDGRLDLAVANYGSNDVSVLFGQGVGDSWTMRPGQARLKVGRGPIAIDVRDVTGNGNPNPDSIPELLVTNGQDGTITVLPGIASRGPSGGFFNDTAASIMSFPGNPFIVQGPTNGFAVSQGGTVYHFDLNNFTQTVQPVFFSPVGREVVVVRTIFLGEFSVPILVAARSDGSVSILESDTGDTYEETLFLTDPELTDPSDLEVVPVGDGWEAYVSDQHSNTLFVFEFDPRLLPAAPEVPGHGADRLQFVDLQPFEDTLGLIPTLLTGGLDRSSPLEPPAGLLSDPEAPAVVATAGQVDAELTPFVVGLNRPASDTGNDGVGGGGGMGEGIAELTLEELEAILQELTNQAALQAPATPEESQLSATELADGFGPEADFVWSESLKATERAFWQHFDGFMPDLGDNELSALTHLPRTTDSPVQFEEPRLIDARRSRCDPLHESNRASQTPSGSLDVFVEETGPCARLAGDTEGARSWAQAVAIALVVSGGWQATWRTVRKNESDERRQPGWRRR